MINDTIKTSLNFFTAVKADMQLRQRAWQKEQDELSANFKKLCKCRKKTLTKANDDLAVYVAKKQLEFLKRVGYSLSMFNSY